MVVTLSTGTIAGIIYNNNNIFLFDFFNYILIIN